MMRVVLCTLVAFITGLITLEATAQLNGTYSIGPSGDYGAIEDAISDLNRNGVDGPVVFEIEDGTYTTPSDGYDLWYVFGMNSTNTVTFRPQTDANVTIIGSVGDDAIFTIEGGDYYVIDGNSSSSGVTRNMQIINTYNSSYTSAIRIHSGADYNVVRNCELQCDSYYYLSESGGGVVYIGGWTGRNGSCDYNVIENNQIGDPRNSYRSRFGVVVLGGSGDESYGNEIRGNDIVNYGKGENQWFDGYGVYVEYSPGTVISGNQLHQTESAEISYLYGVFIYDAYDASPNCVVERNAIYELDTYSGDYGVAYGVFYVGYGGGSENEFIVRNNMIAFDQDPSTECYAIYADAWDGENTISVLNNSINLSGDGNYAMIESFWGVYTVNHYNNIIYSTRSGFTYGLFAERVSNFNSDYNLIDLGSSSDYVLGYYNGSEAQSLSGWQGQTGLDQNSFEGDPGFESDVDLHISPVLPSMIESRGMVIDQVVDDIDGDARHASFPDIGADEGDFNGDGIRVVYPNGGESLIGNYQADVRFTLNRPLPVDIYISTDNGASWNLAMSLPESQTAQGTNVVTVPTPNAVTSQALLRIVSALNSSEVDESDRTFSFVLPKLYLRQPNGGQRWTATDTNQITWQSEFTPPTLPVRVDYSFDNGATWVNVTGGLVSQNMPALNSFSWIIPNTPTTVAKVRVMLDGTDIGDTSDAVFTIIEQPGVRVVKPNGGERLVPGQTYDVEFASTTTDNIRVEYSSDGGTTWEDIAYRVPSYVGKVQWTVPNVPTVLGLVRVTNRERPRFTDQSDNYFYILSPELTVLTPNGGGYELNEPVTVTWNGNDLTTLKLEYSSDNGATWTTVATGLDGDAGTATFTPLAVATDAGRVRLTDETITSNTAMNQLAFKIFNEPSLQLFAPSEGDRFERGSQTRISWDAYRVVSVDVYYSLNDGTTWTSVQQNVPAVKGFVDWTVPNTLTTQGRVEVRERGGSRVVTSGRFSIVAPKNPLIRVITPNGGESFTEGMEIPIRWSATDIDGPVSIYYSVDDGTTWIKIAGGVAATDGGTTGSYDWTLPRLPGTGYRVKVEATPSVFDVSDNSFTITRELDPSLTLIYPNGGEVFTGGTSELIRWSSVDVTGAVEVAYSTDNGATWIRINSVPVGAGQLSWTVPTVIETEQALVRVAGPGGVVNDASDDVFTITQPVVPEIVVLSPNGRSDTWIRNQQVNIRWRATNVPQVKIEASSDGGSSWRTIADAVDATLGTMNTTVEDYGNAKLQSMLVRISDAANPATNDVSDEAFNYDPGVAAVPGVVVSARGIQVQGAFPNPFAERTELRWRQPASGVVMLRLFNGDGKAVRELPLGMRPAGEQTATLEGAGLPAGSYLYELRIGELKATGRVVIVR